METKTKKKSGRPKENKEPMITWPILMPIEFKKKYKTFCESQAISMNRRVRLLMQKDLNGEIKF